ncbi:MAG: hypothetical protein QOJ98_1804, partial [Acidobacteriota bacterium]|nr:hypothetical protein [Acidobacteriota bacterium]
MTTVDEGVGPKHERGSVTADDPWPGLLSFEESDQRFFRGRTDETNALLQLIRRDTLTILFGRAGLGKTSLLRAGVFPRLREESFLPVEIRLAYAPGSASLRQQVLDALRLAGQDAAITVPQSADTTLWEYFHRRDVELWDRNRLAVPVLVFDQFEEIFTHGRSRQAEVNDFLDDLASLMTGRPPELVRRRLEGNAAAGRSFDFTRRSYRVLVSLREDFVPHLETLRSRVSSILDRRLRLEPMNGKAALEVLGVGAHLLDPGAGDAVLRFVASPRATAAADLPLEQLVIEPALLSVVCQELNEKRRAAGEPRITTDLLKGTKTEIITAFYERGVHDYPTARTFIEENLITDEGFRVPIARERARRAGVPDAVLDALVEKHRLIRPIRIGDVDHIELTHDLLTDAIRESRDERRKREFAEAERTLARTRKSLVRARAAVAVFVLLLILGAVVFAIGKMRETARYQRWVSQNNVRLAARLLEDGNTEEALALLANALRRDHENLAAHRLVFGTLLGRRWPKLEHEVPLRGSAVERSPGGMRLAVWVDDAVQVFDVPTGKEIRSFQIDDKVTCVSFNENGHLLAVGTKQGSVSLLDIDSASILGEWQLHTEFVRALTVTHDGALLASGANDGIVNVVDVQRGVTMAQPVRGWVFHLEFSPSGDRLVSASKIDPLSLDPSEVEPEGDSEVILWAMPQFQRINAHPMLHGGAIWSVHFDADGSRVVSASADKTAQVWDATTGKGLGRPLAHSADVNDAEFSPDGTLLATVSNDRTARIWYVEHIARLKTAPWSSVLQHKNKVA